MNRFQRCISILCVALIATTAQAQDAQLQERCKTAYNALARQGDVRALDVPEEAACEVLAQAIETIFSEYALFGSTAGQDPTSLITPRDLQSNEQHGAAQGGTPAQGEAVPSTEPLGLAGGSLSAIGSEGGADAITALTLNPSIFFLAGDDAPSTAGWGRFTDLTVLFPVNDANEDEDQTIDYFGVRARVNVTGFQQGSALYDSVKSAYQQVLNQASVNIDNVKNALTQAATDTTALKRCANALVRTARGESADLAVACGTQATVFTRDGRINAFRKALEAVRRQADTHYFGLDLRTDFGDPTLGAVDSSAGTYLFGGLAWGRRFRGQGVSTTGLRARLGMQYVDLDDFEDPLFLFDASLGFEWTRPFAFQQLSLSGGLDARVGGKDDLDEHVETDYLYFRSTFNVPLSDAYSVSLNVGVPIVGDRTRPVIGINANWKLLWPQQRPPFLNTP